MWNTYTLHIYYICRAYTFWFFVSFIPSPVALFTHFFFFATLTQNASLFHFVNAYFRRFSLFCSSFVSVHSVSLFNNCAGYEKRNAKKKEEEKQ